MQSSALCRSRRELSSAYLLATFGFDTAENEPYFVSMQRLSVLAGCEVRRADAMRDAAAGGQGLPRPALDEMTIWQI